MIIFRTYYSSALDAAVLSVLGDFEHTDDLSDLSDHVRLQMAELHGIEVEDFFYTGGGVEINVEPTTLTDPDLLDLLVESVKSFTA